MADDDLRDSISELAATMREGFAAMQHSMLSFKDQSERTENSMDKLAAEMRKVFANRISDAGQGESMNITPWELERVENAAEDAERNAATQAVLREIQLLSHTEAFLALSQPRHGTSSPSGIVGHGGNDG